MKIIDSFKGVNNYLSNFHNAPVTYKGLTYKNNESAFQAQKDISRIKEFVDLPPNEGKRLGRKVKLRNDWDDVRLGIMKDIVLAKFSQNENLRQKLINTGDAELIEGNTWNDKFWGVCKGQGQNHLGAILMKVRDELK